MHLLNGTLPGLYGALPGLNGALPGLGALVAHQYTYEPSAAEPRRTFIPLSVSIWNDLVDHVFDGVGLAGFKSRSNAFLLA